MSPTALEMPESEQRLEKEVTQVTDSHLLCQDLMPDGPRNNFSKPFNDKLVSCCF